MEDLDKWKKAGKIAAEVREYGKSLVAPGKTVLEITELLEKKIEELGAKPAFPPQLSLNEAAAHECADPDDNVVLLDQLVKVDVGVHIDGWAADTAFSLDLENNEENKKLIKAGEEALENALNLVKSRIEVNEKNKVNDDKVGSSIKDTSSGLVGGNELIGLDEIGKTIQETIESHGFTPVANLSGHSIGHYDLHSGITVPNIDNKVNLKLKEGLYAIEPFATNGNGKVHDGKPSGIYYLLNEKTPRSPLGREVLSFIIKEYQTLPFCSRWIVKALGSKALFGLRELEANGNLHHFAQLVEAQNSIVSQAEQTILIEKNKVTVTTL